MDFTNIPITEFYRHCLPAAYENGYFWICTLLAREADVDRLYQNLRQCWGSLDSITGKRFLFIFAGKENRTRKEVWNSKILDTHTSGGGEYSNYVSFINPDTELKYRLTQYDWRKDEDENLKLVAENQTAAINSLREYFDLTEADIPCLVFTSTRQYMSSRETRTHIIQIRGNDIYRYFKHLFNNIEPKLKQIEDAIQEKNSSETELAKISKEKTNYLTDLCNGLHLEISNIIGESTMDFHSNGDEKLSIIAKGETVQINAAFDDAKVEAIQNIGVNEQLLKKLVENVRKEMPSTLTPDKIDIINKNLEVIVGELKQSQPRKSFLNTILNGLKAIKGTAEFSAAIVALVQFIQTSI